MLYFATFLSKQSFVKFIQNFYGFQCLKQSFKNTKLSCMGLWNNNSPQKIQCLASFRNIKLDWARFLAWSKDAMSIMLHLITWNWTKVSETHVISDYNALENKAHKKIKILITINKIYYLESLGIHFSAIRICHTRVLQIFRGHYKLHCGGKSMEVDHTVPVSTHWGEREAKDAVLKKYENLP